MTVRGWGARAPWLVAATALAAGALLVLRCIADRGPDPATAFRREALALRDRTTPPSASAWSGISDITRAVSSVEVGWDLTLTQDWPSYVKWVTARLAPDFRSSSASDRLDFVRYTAGDAYRIHVERLSAGAPIRIRVTLSAHPD